MKKLKNKKTGEIGELQITEKHYAVVVGNGTADCYVKMYSSLAKLNEEWEDAPEEPKEIHIEGIQNVYMGGGRVYIDYASAQEAELAVRKLKAWKRLKDKGFRFEGWDYYHIDYKFTGRGYWTKETEKDLDLLFGGEE